ncbi:hypothetical protein M758_6G187800 [Ceratodon purpureus]|nr:hypothetical protein M758_6G187800 [Ceratodon purpureus]KAG0614578.1 hypothetical protein M758_6G187800 [Ceratodon purpureus]
MHPSSSLSIIVIHFWRNGSERLSDGSLKIYSTRGWCILDLKARRWYKLYSEKQVKEGQVGCAYDNSTRFTGMDGGLIFQILESWKTNTEDSPRPRLWNQIVVYNPIAKTLKRLPIVPGHRGHPTAPNTATTACSKLHMVVDGVSQDFKIFLINHFQARILDSPEVISFEERSRILSDPLMRVYDSATNEWRSLPNPLPSIENEGHCFTSIMFEGLLYMYPKLYRRGALPLWRYKAQEDAWESFALEFPTELQFIPELAVSANRLLLLTWSAKWYHSFVDAYVDWYLEASELKTPEMTRVTLFKFFEADLMSPLGTQRFYRARLDHDRSPHGDVSVFPFGNSLMFMSHSTGKSIAFDLVTGAWDHEWPQSPLSQFGYMCGKQMGLLLPSTPHGPNESSTTCPLATPATSTLQPLTSICRCC